MADLRNKSSAHPRAAITLTPTCPPPQPSAPRDRAPHLFVPFPPAHRLSFTITLV